MWLLQFTVLCKRMSRACETGWMSSKCAARNRHVVKATKRVSKRNRRMQNHRLTSCCREKSSAVASSLSSSTNYWQNCHSASKYILIWLSDLHCCGRFHHLTTQKFEKQLTDYTLQICNPDWENCSSLRQLCKLSWVGTFVIV